MHTVLERGRNPCAHSCCVPAPPHAEKYPRLPHYACISMHFYVFLLQLWMSLCINRTTQSSLFSAYYPLLFQHYFSIMHCISLCISNDCEASQSHPYDQKSKPITATKEVKPFYYAYSNQRSETFTFCLMMIKLLLHFLLHFGSNSFKIKRHGPIRNLFDKMAPDFKTSWRDLYDEICSIGPNIERIMSPGGYVSCLNRTKNAIERVQTLPTRSHKKSSSKAILFGSDLGGQKGVISLSSA